MKAIEAFQRAKDLEPQPDSEAARLALAQALRAEGRATEADQVLAAPAPEVWNRTPQ